MVSEKFRHQLRQEVEQWQAEGLIDESLYRQLTHRYQLTELDTAARNRFVMVLIGFGSILLGLAVITFVAANWQVWSRELKMVLLLSLFAGVNIAGFYLWRHSGERWQSRLGGGLLLLGALILGANLALMSQMFHQSGAVYQLFLLWGMGVLVMAYGLRLTPLGILAVILLGISYGAGIIDAFPGRFSPLNLAIAHMPLLVSILVIPLAYWCRSRWLFGLGATLMIISLELNIFFFLGEFTQVSRWNAGILTAIACFLPPMLLWAYRDSLWRFPWHTVSFQPISRQLALLFLGVLFYLFSFNLWNNSPTTNPGAIGWENWFNLIDVFLLGGLTIWAWYQLGYEREDGLGWHIDLNSTLIASLSLLTGGLVWWHISINALGAIATFIFNALLFLLAIGLIREALATGKRLGFWGGIMLMILQLFSRMLEYDTGLLLKAIVLFLCGIAVIFAGLWFERYIHTLNVDSYD